MWRKLYHLSVNDIDEQEDEFSIGLIAFHDAIQSYTPEKGRSLLKYAETVIKNRVIDYLRKQAKHETDVHVISIKNDEYEYQTKHKRRILYFKKYNEKTDEEERKVEIAAYSSTLANFRLTFSDLAKSSPKHQDARKNAIKIAKLTAENDELKDFVLEKKKLPLKQLETLVDSSRKTIERNRKYIIAISLIFIGDYRYLQDYIKGVSGE